MMRSSIARLATGIALLCGSPAVLPAQRPQSAPADLPSGYDWKASAQKCGLSDREIAQLAEKKVLVRNEAFKQVFVPYLGSSVPQFITSDSLLGGFHVLLEESVVRLEMTNASRLRGILKDLWANLPTAEKTLPLKPPLLAAAKRRATVVLATALLLLGEKIDLEPATAALVQEETGRVEAARGCSKPAWLGPPDRGFLALDYTRYQPRGFYVKRPSLERYFRAVSWLQSIPFRVATDEELAAMLLLGRCTNTGRFREESRRHEELWNLFDSYDSLLGSGDGWDLRAAANAAGLITRAEGTPPDVAAKTDPLAEVRADLRQPVERGGRKVEINDQLALVPDDPTLPAEMSLRVIAARRTPDAVLFGRTTDLRRFQRSFPDGLELCAILGSSFARRRLAAQGDAKLIEELDRDRVLFSGESLYGEYLRCLEVLVAAPEPDAPPLMSSEAWQIKSCQTVLGGWAQLRHTWALQAKQNAHWMCASLQPPGLVEPAPEFYARMAQLSENLQRGLRRLGAFEIDLPSIAEELRKGVIAEKQLEDEMQAAEKEQRDKRLPARDEFELAETVKHLMYRLPVDVVEERDLDHFDALRRKRVIKLAEQLERGEFPRDVEIARTLRGLSPEIESRWGSLATLCRRLETLAHKQLRGVAFNENQNNFVKGYGAALAKLMFYDGNSYIHPRDDAPRVVDVFSNPNTSQFLEVGVGRPCALYVLYPVKGRDVLCRGAVFSYYEFPHGQRLTDAQWLSLLDSPQRPASPSWTGPIASPEKPSTLKRPTGK